ncbi:hypothetical protein SAMN05192534_12343 [Alteribacillus persepolensis]|uniref:Uncharacterized protein n=1 Tax=Alteribacillus persepolensis TaxID=568899 RepID=A0A1G8I8H8_9BACI|nr:hypothetical protein [Alteribacillus persepolensis]SDI15289.1 hypothetical protein SAMN05192534_12343 [Alteribacillus persepolensis]
MQFLELEIAIGLKEELDDEELQELTEDIVDYILRKKNVKGVGHDKSVRYTEPVKPDLSF